ncbi:PP2C family protein-serine/threonine phosphatase [Niveispirillum fermenti]|uniref:PP2C family protein-serine/threonine phosphatase n=1 Tax=Niveispirillum fermenti TaxID=1233113 RepID=UPI003A8511E7
MDNPIHVLVVDDDALMRKLLTALIGQHDFRVSLAHDGLSALEALRSGEEIDLVISDWEMPGITGVELCRELRAMNLPHYVHFILLTARQGAADFSAAMAAGADDFLLKPISPPILKARLEVVKRLLELQQRLRRKNRLLAEANEQIKTAYARLQEDMEAAAVAQRCLLPEPIKDMGPLRFASFMLPSTFVSGDMYNYLELPDGSVAFYMVDVAGHGARAALLSVTLNHLLDVAAFVPHAERSGPAPERIISELNRRFARVDAGMPDYFTMICGIISPGGDSMTFCQAGHPSPIIIDPGKPIRAAGDGGFPVGLMADGDYLSVTVPLAPGTRVVLYSDGMTECARPDGEQFGEERLHILLDSSRDAPLADLDAILCGALTKWQGSERFEDDVSILAFEVVSGR